MGSHTKEDSSKYPFHIVICSIISDYCDIMQMHDHMIRYEVLQEDLDTSMAESEGYAEQLAAAQRQIRQYENQILHYERDLDSVAEDLEIMHGRAQEAERQV